MALALQLDSLVRPMTQSAAEMEKLKKFPRLSASISIEIFASLASG